MATMTPAGHLAGRPLVRGTTPWGKTFAFILQQGREAGVPESDLPAEFAGVVPALLAEGILEQAVREDGTPVLRAVLSSRRAAHAGRSEGDASA